MEDESESLTELFEEFRLARQSAKPSPHSERPARSDFDAIHGHLVKQLGAEDPTVDDRSPQVLRLAFAAYTADHAPASIARVW